MDIRLKWYSVFTLFIGGVTMVDAQDVKLLKGKVVAKNEDVTGVAIQNLTSKKATITDFEGNFSIAVERNDSLIFSAVQFRRKIILVNESILNTDHIVVKLEEFVNELQEVVVQPYNLSGDLKQDLTDLKLRKDVSAEALKLPNADVRIISQSENKLHDADHGKFVYFYGIGGAININKILNRLSGRTKMLKKRVKLDAAYESVRQIENKFIDSILIDYLKIPKTNFYDFIYYCQMDTDFEAMLANNDGLEIWQFLIYKSKAYRKNNDLD